MHYVDGECLIFVVLQTDPEYTKMEGDNKVALWMFVIS